MASADLLDALRDLLERERSALLTGRMDKLERLAALKDALRAELADAPPLAAGPRLDALQALAARNAELLNAARRGIEAARASLGKLNGGPLNFDTYSRDGQLRPMAGHGSRIQKRA